MNYISDIAQIYTENIQRFGNHVRQGLQQHSMMNDRILTVLEQLSSKNPNNLINKLQQHPEIAKQLKSIHDVLFDFFNEARKSGRTESFDVFLQRNRINFKMLVSQFKIDYQKIMDTLDPKTWGAINTIIADLGRFN
jgi:hypothetical protein